MVVVELADDVLPFVLLHWTLTPRLTPNGKSVGVKLQLTLDPGVLAIHPLVLLYLALGCTVNLVELPVAIVDTTIVPSVVK